MNQIVNILFHCIDLYQILIAIYALMSWFPNARASKVWELVNKIIEPYFNLLNSWFPALWRTGFTAIFAYFILEFVQRGIIFLLYR